jgi:hypothetical protein
MPHGFLGDGDASGWSSLNIEFWAQITSYDGVQFYGWQEMVPSPSAGAGSFAISTGGKSGTTTSGPIYEANGNILQIGSIVRVRRAYFDPPPPDGNNLDWVYLTCCCPCASA